MATILHFMQLGFRSILLGSLVFMICLGNCCPAEDKPAAAPETVDFERHIAPLFGRLGCNSAACHGAFGGGKGGLQLSLFGYSAEMDYRAIDDRIDRTDVDSSLLLLKPSGQEAHEGGVRFKSGSGSYRAIRRWIDQGAKWNQGSGSVKTLSIEPRQVVLTVAGSPSQRLRVTAEFTDGTCEDVTHLCQFTSRDEGIAAVESDGRVVRSSHGDTSVIISYSNAFGSVSVLAPFPAGGDNGFASRADESNFIDTHINNKLSRLNIVPAESCTDEEFLRRVMIDTIGAIPEPQELIRFCADTSPAKRERKIEELLAHPMHAALWATRMCDMTKCDVRSMGEDELLAARRAQMWHDWFRKLFRENISYAEIVRGVVTATSREDLSVSDWMQREEEWIHRSRQSFAGNYADRETLDLYWRRVNSDAQAQLKTNAELTAVAFTGVRLNCAQCHKHPFDRWTQDDYAAFANIFSRVIYGTSTETNAAILDELARRRESKKTDKSTRPLPRMREVFTSAELGRALSGSVPGVVSPRPLTGPEFDQEKDLRQQFYDWLVSPKNPYFAPSFVNRVWAAYFGIGMVDPVDDFSITTPPSHPELLSELAQSFRESGFDIRRLEKQILMSAAYQRSASPNASNRNDRRNFSRQYVRPLMAEVALDAINKALGTSEDFGDFAREGALAIEVGTNELPGHPGHALQALGRGKRESTCDCDRRTESDLRQVIYLIKDHSIFTKIETGSIRELLNRHDRELVEGLYLRMLGRKPDAAEIRVGVEHLRNAANRELAFDDLVWALLNTREFITNH